MKKWRKVLLVLVLACLAAGQCVTAQAAKKTSSKYKVTMDKSIYTMKKGKSVQLKASKNNAAKKKKVVWTSSNKKVATVSSKGKVKAKKNGKTTITAKLQGTKVKAACKIVVGTPVTSVKFEKKTVELEEGGKAKLKVKVAPKKPTNKKVTYKSSNKSVVTVNSKGEIKAVKAGKAKITVMAADGTGKSAACTVTVKEKKVNTQPVDPNPNPEPEPEPEPNPNPEPEPNPNPEPDILVESVALSETDLSMLPGESKKLSAAVKPDNATNKALTWKSSATEVVTVDSDGTVKAVGEGTAAVTVTAQSGKSASCTVKVAYKGAVSNQTELNQALSSKMVSDIVYNSNAADDIVIPAGDYSSKTLEINAPNADVANNGKFKKVTVNTIEENTYTENSENVIYYNTAKGSMVVGQSGNATINLSSGGDQEFTLENNGNVQDLNVSGKNTVLNIKGTRFVNVTLGIGASNSSVVASTELRITASVRWDMTILPGAEHTRASIDNNSCLPSVWGLGCISVKIVAENDVINIPAEMKDGLGINEKVTVSGNVNEYYLKDAQPEDPEVSPGDAAEEAGGGTSNEKEAVNEPSANAKIYMLPFTKENSGISEESYQQFVQGIESSAVTDKMGMFTIENAGVGNYWMIVEKEGYKANVKNVVITSGQSGSYACGTTVLLSNEIAACSNAPAVSGTVKVGLTAEPVTAGFQVKLRKGSGNILGEAYKTTETDSEGNYQFTDVPAGVYTVEVLDLRQGLPANAERYNAANIDIVVAYPYLPSGGHNCVVDQQMETVTGQSQVQFTLTWGNEESGASSDIDSHLVGPRADGDGEFHVYYANRDYYADGEKMADLDVDDTTYEGPEHTTIYKETAGVYRFYVRNYSERTAEDSEMLAKSSIKVRVTIGANSYVYNCPNAKGNLWYVCDYDSVTHTIIPRNVVCSFLDEESYIGLSVEEMNARYLERKKSEALGYAAAVKGNLVRFSDNAAKAGISERIAELEGQVDSVKELAEAQAILSELQQIQDKLDNVSGYFLITADNLKDYDRTTLNEYDGNNNLTGVCSILQCSLDFGDALVNPKVTADDGTAVLEPTTEEGYAYVVHVTDKATGLACDVWVKVLASQEQVNTSSQAQVNISNQAKACYELIGFFEENDAVLQDKGIVDGIIANLSQVTDEESYDEAASSLGEILSKYEELSNTFSIATVTAEAGIKDWRQSQDSIYGETGEEEIGKLAVLKIEKNSETADEDVLSKLNITFSDESITYVTADSDAEGYSKLIKATDANGFVKKIYIRITSDELLDEINP